MATGDKLVNLDSLKAVYDSAKAMAAPTEASSTASAAHSAGSYFILGGTLYEATTNIAIGGTITPGTNCQTIPNGLSGEVSDLKSELNQTSIDRDNTRLFMLKELCGENLYSGGDIERYVSNTATYQNTKVEISLSEAGDYCAYYLDKVYTDVGYVNPIAIYSDSATTTMIASFGNNHYANFNISEPCSIWLKIQWSGNSEKVPANAYTGRLRGIKVCKQSYTGKIPNALVEKVLVGTNDIENEAVTPEKTSFFATYESYNKWNPINDNKYILSSGKLGNNSSYVTSDYIPVSPGDIIRHQFTYTANNIRFDNVTVPNYTSINFVAGYDGNKVYVEGSYKATASDNKQTTYTVPSGVSFIRATISKQDSFIEHAMFASSSSEVLAYEPYSSVMAIPTTLLPVDDDAVDSTHLWSAQKIHNSISDISNTSSALNGNKIIKNQNTGSSISIDVPQFKKNIDIGFAGFFDSWSDLYIYQGKTTGFTGKLCKITSTNIEIWRMDTYNLESTDPLRIPVFTASHGLTIADYISVVISETNNNACKIYIASNGGMYTSTETQWGASRKDILVEHGSASWTNILTWGSKDFLERTWLYGDSYFDHWLRKVLERGNTAFVDDGYSGGTSTNALASLQLALTMGCPQKIVWCLGMNDKDNATEPAAVNASWKNAVDTIKAICNSKRIDLVLTTIPNVPGTNGASRDHSYKNAYIKDPTNNFNYIDIAEYVGGNTYAGSNTEWYSGLLSSDGVHPSTAGDFYIANLMQTFLPDLRNS